MASGKSNDEGPGQLPIGLVGLSRAGFVPKRGRKARSTAGIPIHGINGRRARQSFLVDKATIEPVGRPTVNIGHVDLMRHVCPPPSVLGSSNWARLVGKSTQSNFVGFSIFSGGYISFGSTFGYSGGVGGGISVGGISSDNDGSMRGSMNGMGSGINYGVGGSGHGRSGGFFLEDGNGHGSACPTDISSSNWISLVRGRGSGNSGNAQSNYVGFRILSGGGISFGGNSSSIIIGNSSSVGDIFLGGSSNGVDGSVIGTGNGMGINISYGAGGSGHGGSGGFFVDNGRGHGSSHLANNINSICARLPTSYMVGPSNWTSLAHGSESGNNRNTQSNYVGFRISSDGCLSFGGSSCDIAFGNSRGIDDIGGFGVDDGRGHGSSHLANDTNSMCGRPPHSDVVGPSNWTSLADGSGSGSNNNSQSNYVGFRISSDGGLSFVGGSRGSAFGNSGGTDNIFLGGSSNGVDGGVSSDGNCSGSGMSSGVGGSGHEWFFNGEGSGHGSSRSADK